MIYWLLLIPCCLFAKVYDCFPFFNELELLQVRFAELDGVVDHFVLVESVETQRGEAKPLYFAENKHLFEKYLPKVIHVVIHEPHPNMGLWERENYQRNEIARGLTGCTSSDIVILSDLDEIPRASVIARWVEALEAGKSVQVIRPPCRSKKAKRRYETKHAKLGAYACEMSSYHYQLNRQMPDQKAWDGSLWCGTIIMKYAALKKHSPQYFRKRRNKLPRIEQGGWHFTWMGGKDKIRQKLVSVVEGRADGASISDAEIEAWIAGHPVVPLDGSFPRYILEHQDYFRSIGFLADSE